MKRNFLYSLAVILLIIASSCEEVRNKPGEVSSLEGEWTVKENSEKFKSRHATYNVYISLSADDSTRISISNFYHMGYDNEIIGTVDGNRIELPSGQKMSMVESVYVLLSGVGNISSDYQSISWQYEIDDGSGTVDHVTATYTRVTK